MASFQPYSFSKITTYQQQATLHKRYEPQMSAYPNAGFVNQPKEMIDFFQSSGALQHQDNSDLHLVKDQAPITQAQSSERQERNISTSSKILTIKSSQSAGNMKNQGRSSQDQSVKSKQNSFQTNLYQNSQSNQHQNESQSTTSQRNVNSSSISSISINMTSSGSMFTAQRHKELIQAKQRMQKQLQQLRAQSPSEQSSNSLRAKTEQSLDRNIVSNDNIRIQEKQSEQFYMPKSKGKARKGSKDQRSKESLNQGSFESSKNNQLNQRNSIISLSKNSYQLQEIKGSIQANVPKLKQDQPDQIQISQQITTIQPEEKQQTITIFIHSNCLKIGPIILNTFGRNIDWMTSFLIKELQTLEEMRGQTLTKKNEKILHFQSYNHSNISLSYYLTLKERPLSALNNKNPLVLEPFYSEKVTYTCLKGINQIGLKDFNFIKCVGIGGFSRVYLVQKKDNGKMYALKLIEKKFIEENRKQDIVQNERNIMTMMQSQPFLLQLDYAFESNGYIAFVFEYCAGGEMFYHLRKLKRMTEDQARFYFLEICLGIQFLHKNHIIYRDIKPENILLDIDGHVRIGDFGLSKPEMDLNEFAHSFCGSPEYMAPEMLLKTGHTYSVDHYTLGALLYEFITGLPPYYSQDTEKLYSNILTEDLIFPTDISKELKNLLAGLLTKTPSSRLGKTGGMQDIINHPWCRKINLSDILTNKIQTPIKIDVVGFNFDEEEFKKGDEEFRKKLTATFFSQKYRPMFSSFYYESPNLKQSSFKKEQIKSDRIKQSTPKNTLNTETDDNSNSIAQIIQSSSKVVKKQQTPLKVFPSNKIDLKSTLNKKVPLSGIDESKALKETTQTEVTSSRRNLSETINQQNNIGSPNQSSGLPTRINEPKASPQSSSVERKQNKSQTNITLPTQKIDVFHVPKMQSSKISNSTCEQTQEHQSEISSYSLEVTKSRLNTLGEFQEQSTPLLSSSRRNSKQKLIINSGIIDAQSIQMSQPSHSQSVDQYPNSVSQKSPHKHTKSDIKSIFGISLQSSGSFDQNKPSHFQMKSEIKTKHKPTASQPIPKGNQKVPETFTLLKKSNSQNRFDIKQKTLLKIAQLSSKNRLRSEDSEGIIDDIFDLKQNSDVNRQNSVDEENMQIMKPTSTSSSSVQEPFNYASSSVQSNQNSITQKLITRTSSDVVKQIYHKYGNPKVDEALNNVSINQKNILPGSSSFGIQQILNSYGGGSQVNRVIDVSPKQKKDSNNSSQKILSPRIDKKQILISFSQLQSSSFTQKCLASPRSPNTKYPFFKRPSTSTKCSMTSLLNPTKVYSPLGFI